MDSHSPKNLLENDAPVTDNEISYTIDLLHKNMKCSRYHIQDPTVNTCSHYDAQEQVYATLKGFWKLYIHNENIVCEEGNPPTQSIQTEKEQREWENISLEKITLDEKEKIMDVFDTYNRIMNTINKGKNATNPKTQEEMVRFTNEIQNLLRQNKRVLISTQEGDKKKYYYYPHIDQPLLNVSNKSIKEKGSYIFKVSDIPETIKLLAESAFIPEEEATHKTYTLITQYLLLEQQGKIIDFTDNWGNMSREKDSISCEHMDTTDFMNNIENMFEKTVTNYAERNQEERHISENRISIMVNTLQNALRRNKDINIRTKNEIYYYPKKNILYLR